jgi:hypothetical protein
MKKAIVFILTAVVTFGTTTIASAATETIPPTISNSLNKTFYPLTGIVTSVTPDDSDTCSEVITFTCSNGNMFSFTAPTTDCWEEADLVSCIMNNKGTETVYDDEVITSMYSGSTDQLEAQFDYTK